MTKYKAKPIRIDGILFPSKKEAMRYIVLKDEARRGIITDFERQPSFKLWVPAADADRLEAVGIYRADFQYKRDGKLIIEDVKGFKTPVYRLKKKMVEAYYGVRIKET